MPTIEEMKATILQSKLPKRKIDIHGKGKGVWRLEQSKEVSAKKLLEMYNTVISHIDNNVDNAVSDGIDNKSSYIDKYVDNKSTEMSNNVDNLSKQANHVDNGVDNQEIINLKKRLEEHEKAIDNLLMENKKLREEMETLKITQTASQAILNNSKPIKIEGFTLSQRKTGGNIAYWYAGKVINGKLTWVYIGRTLDKAKEKVIAYLEKHHGKNG